MFDINAESILVDELVQNDKTYKDAVSKILKTCKAKCLMRPTLRTYKRFEEAYWNTRVNGCGKPKCPDASGCNCYNNKLLASALKKRKDIIFESALTGNLEWLFERIPPEYNIVFFCEFVGIEYDYEAD
jgi:hypothetical protein